MQRLHAVRALILAAGRRLGVSQSEERLMASAQRYWQHAGEGSRRHMAHIRDGGLGDDVFDALGRQAAERMHRFARVLGTPTEGLRVLEWGCGGGTNLVALSPMADELIGLDVSDDILASAHAELKAAGRTDFTPVRVDLANPEAVLDEVHPDIDLFVCFYVFELLPSPEYGRRILRIAARLLKPGGMAVIQIKYRSADPRTAPRRFSYAASPASMTTYGIDEFWIMAGEEGLTPRCVELEPRQPLVHDERYAYFLLTAPDKPPPLTAV